MTSIRNPRFILLITVALVLFFGACQWLFSDWYTINSDQLFYSVSLDLFASQLWHGDGYPRILFDADGGAGSAVFLVYGPLPFYALSVFYPLMDVLFNQLDYYFFGMTLAFLLCVFVHYKWMREYLDTRLAMWATLWFSLMPFKFINLYIRANLAYFFTLACLMGALMFTERMLKGKTYAWFGLTFSMAGMVLSHVPSVLMVGWVPFVYVWLVQRARGGAILSPLIRVCTANIAAALLCTFFLLPGHINQHWLTLGEATNLGYVFDNDFVWWNLSLLIVGAALCVWTLRRPAASGAQPSVIPTALIKVAAVCCLFTLFMISPLSIPLWEHIPVMGWIQMPFRFLILFDVWFGLISVMALSHLRIKRYWILGVLLIGALLHGKLFIEFGTYKSKDMHIARAYHMIAPAHDVFRTPHTSKEAYHVRHRAKRVLEPSIQAASGGQVTMLRQDVRHWQIDADIQQAEESLTIRKYYMPNMQLIDEQSGQVIALTPDVEGFSTFKLPQGKHHLTLAYQPIPMQREANIVSFLTLLVLGALAMLRRKKPGACSLPAKRL